MTTGVTVAVFICAFGVLPTLVFYLLDIGRKYLCRSDWLISTRSRTAEHPWWKRPLQVALRSRWWPGTGIVASLTITIVLVLVVYGPSDTDSIQISIGGLKGERQTADGMTYVTGWDQTVQGRVEPPHARVVIFVHGVKDDKWWVQEQVQRYSDGTWWASVKLGEAVDRSSGQYQLMAIAWAAPWAADLLKWRSFDWDPATPRPPALPHSRIVSVWRSE